MLKSLSENPSSLIRDIRKRQMDQAFIILGVLFPADQESSEAVQPGMRPLDDPTSGSRASLAFWLRRRLAFQLDMRDVGLFLRVFTNARRVIPFVSAQVLRQFVRSGPVEWHALECLSQ